MDIRFAALARETGISVRTLQRWNQLYRIGGVSALDSHPRTDEGVRRTSAETIAFMERLALTRPRPSIATLHRRAGVDSQARALPAPSYATVREVVQSLDPARVTLALEGPLSYRDKHDLDFRRRPERPNQTWQSDHTELDILILEADGKADRPWLTTFRLLERLFPEINRVLKINQLDTITDDVIEAAASIPVIGR